MNKFKMLILGALLIGASQHAKGGDLIDMWQNSSKIDKMERMGKALEDISTPQKYKELQEKKTQFLSEINVALNISNAECTLDIDLETA